MEEKLTQYLTFTLAEEVYAVTVGKVREVLDIVSITKVPKMPFFMKGVLNLRGSVVPVIDLRLKFGLEALEDLDNASIIILEIQRADKLVLMGALVDAVHEVIDLIGTTIESAPNVGTSVDASFIEGMCEHGDKFLILLDIEKVLNTDEIIMISKHSKISDDEEMKDETLSTPAEALETSE